MCCPPTPPRYFAMYTVHLLVGPVILCSRVFSTEEMWEEIRDPEVLQEALPQQQALSLFADLDVHPGSYPGTVEIWTCFLGLAILCTNCSGNMMYLRW